MKVKEYVDAQLDLYHAELDRRMLTTRRELEAEHEYVDRVFAERERAVVRQSEERELAAEALRRELARSAVEGDERLREHIENQRTAVLAALEAADKIEKQRLATVNARVDGVEEAAASRIAGYDNFRESVAERFSAMALLSEDRLAALRREIERAATVQEEANRKADKAAADKFIAHNGLIEQMRQQAVKSEQALATLVGTLLPRETFDAYKESVEERLNRGSGEQTGRAASTDYGRWLLGTIIAVLSLVLYIAVATQGFHK